MGVEYAIVCDRTREALDLGKGPWWNLFEDEEGRAVVPDEAKIVATSTDGSRPGNITQAISSTPRI